MQNLTKKQTQIYELYFIEKLTQKAIASRLQMTQPAVSKIIRKIRKKTGVRGKITGGLYSKGRVENITPPTHKKLWAFHALHFIVKPYYFAPRYEKIRKERGNYGITEKNFTIMLLNGCVRIQSREGVRYRHKERWEAVKQGEEDFNRFLRYAANKYGFYYEKEGRVSIKLVSSELAQEGSEIGRDYNSVAKENYLTVIGKDGKVWFLIDQSTPNEHEFIGRHTLSNSEKVTHYLNDLLYNQPLTNSQLATRLNDVITALEKITEIIK